MIQWKTCTFCGADDMPHKSGVTICLNEECSSNSADNLFDKKIAITGTFKCGEQRTVHQLAKGAGATVKGSVTRQVDFLVKGGRTSSYTYKSQKELDAQRYGIRIIDEDEFLSMTGANVAAY